MARARTQPDPGVDPEVQAIINLTKPGRDEHDRNCETYDKAYDVYRATARPRGDSWQSRLRIKYGMQTIDTAMVNMVQQTPRCKVMPRTPEHIMAAKGFQLVFDYFIDEDDIAGKQPDTAHQALIYGLTVGKNHWLYKEGNRIVRGLDAQTGAPAPVMETYTVRDGPSYEPWDVYDAWWDPSARSVEAAEWVALRSWLSKEQLLKNACTVQGDHPLSECDGLYHNVEALLLAGTQPQRRETAQESALGGTVNLRKDRFEVVEYWRDDALAVIGNSKIMLRTMPNPHWHGMKPVVVASTRPDMFRIQGIPETELVADLQDALNTLLNMRFDNLHLTAMRGFTYREGGVTDPNALVLRPRFLWPVTDHDDVKGVDIQPLPPEAYEEEQSLLAHIRDVTGINAYVTGAAAGNVDQNTATGISILNSAATALLRFKSRQVLVGVWQPTWKMWGADIQQFLDTPMWVRLTDDPQSAKDFAFVDPTAVAGEFDFKLVGTEDSISKQQDRQEALSLLTAFAPLAQTGIVNFKALLERVAVAFDIPKPEDLFTQPQQAPPAAPYGNFGSQGGHTPLPNGNAGPQLYGTGQMPSVVSNAITAGQ